MTEAVPAYAPAAPAQPKKRWEVWLVEKGRRDATPRQVKLKIGGGITWFKIAERAIPFMERIPDGAFVKVTFYGGDTISTIKEVDEYGEDKPKAPYKGSSGGYSKKVDPEAEREKAEQIIYQTALKAAEAFVSNIIQANSGSNVLISKDDIGWWWEKVLACSDKAAQNIIEKTRGDKK